MTLQTIQSRYESLEVNESIVLFEGSVTLSWDSQSFTGGGGIYLDWQPRPRVTFRVTCPAILGFLHIDPTTSVIIECADLPGKGNCRVWGSELSNSPTTNTMFGSIDGPFIVGNPAPTSVVKFHVPNFPNYVGATTMYGTDVSASRLTAETDRWHVDLDGVSRSFDLYSSLEKQGGFAITNVGSVMRTDGKAIKFKEVEPLATALYWWLSFLRSERTGPILLSGEHDGETVWEIWRSPTISPWMGRQTWMPVPLVDNPSDEPNSTSPILNEIIETFKDQDAFRVLIRAISWYTQSVENGYLETIVILAQAGLELMSWLKLVDEVGIGDESFKNWNAADQLRLALSYAKISPVIPSTSSGLFAAAKKTSKQEAVDGPGAITAIRNGVIHPKLISRFGDIEVMHEGALLATRYLELLLLNRCKYFGEVRNRANWPEGDMPVPWT